jgi:hypothetical protein
MIKTYAFEADIKKESDIDGAYVEMLFDIREVFGKGRVKVHSTFDGEPYEGTIVNIGINHDDDRMCYFLGLRQDIRAKNRQRARRQRESNNCGKRNLITYRKFTLMIFTSPDPISKRR